MRTDTRLSGDSLNGRAGRATQSMEGSGRRSDAEFGRIGAGGARKEQARKAAWKRKRRLERGKEVRLGVLPEDQVKGRKSGTYLDAGKIERAKGPDAAGHLFFDPLPCVFSVMLYAAG